MMCCVGFAPNIALRIQDIRYISLPNILQFYFSARTDVFEFVYSAQASFFSLCHLGVYCGVTQMLLIHPQFSLITAIKLCNCFKFTIGLMVWFPSIPATELGRTPVSL